MLESLLPLGDGLALDLGAGSGRHRRAIEMAGYRYVGCDYRGGPAIDLRADAHRLPFPSETFVLVNLWQVMEYLRDPLMMLAEVRRVLRPGGMIVGSVSFLEPMHGKVYFNFSQWGLEELLARTGFCQISVKPGIGCFPLICWNWARQLTGSEPLARAARRGAALAVWVIAGICERVAALRKAAGRGTNFTGRWLREIMPLHYAGQLTFLASRARAA